MPAVAAKKLSLEEFRARYNAEKPYFEYWDGEAVQKSMPTLLHALIQGILLRWLGDLGFTALPEVTLRLSPDYEPVPDVIAVEEMLDEPYPTRPFEVAVEILSPADSFSRVTEKCRFYAEWRIRQVVVIDPENRVVWIHEDGSLGNRHRCAAIRPGHHRRGSLGQGRQDQKTPGLIAS